MGKFYICKVCGNLVELINEGKGQMICCGQPMNEIKANVVDASLEKHVPVLEIVGNILNVTVGSVEHPMLEEHYIEWIYVVADDRVQRVKLHPGTSPKASFDIGDAKHIEVYEHCNIHGLWKAEYNR